MKRWLMFVILVIVTALLVLAQQTAFHWKSGVTAPVSTSEESLKPNSQQSANEVPWRKLTSENKFFTIKNGEVYVLSGGEFVGVAGADAATFLVPDDSIANQIATYEYEKDKNTVYYRSEVDGALIPLRGPDVDTFTVIAGEKNFDAKDKNHTYFAGGITCEDVSKETCTLYDGPGYGNGHWFQD